MNNILMKLSTLIFLFPFITHAAPLMYVPTGTANDLVIIDLNTDKIVDRIPELENSHGLATSPNTEYLVAGSMKPVEKGATKKASKPAAVSEEEHAAHHAGGSQKNPIVGPSYVSIVHPKHGHVMRRIAVRGISHHTAVSPNGKLAIAVHSGAGGISVIDLDRMEVVHTLQTGLWPNYAVFSGDGKWLYVSNANPGTVSEIDTNQWKVIRNFKVGKEPEHIVLSPDSKTLFTSNKGDGTVSMLNLIKGEVINTFATGKSAHGIDLSDDGKWLFSASKSEHRLTRIDLSSNKSISVDLKPAPYHLSYISGMNKLYVSSRKLPKIWVVDATTLQVTGEIDLGKGVAHQMVIRK